MAHTLKVYFLKLVFKRGRDCQDNEELHLRHIFFFKKSTTKMLKVSQKILKCCYPLFLKLK